MKRQSIYTDKKKKNRQIDGRKSYNVTKNDTVLRVLAKEMKNCKDRPPKLKRLYKYHALRTEGPCTDLRHDAVSSRPLLVLELDVGVVVDDQAFELGVGSRDGPLGYPAGPQRVLRHVGNVLLEDQRSQFPRSSSATRASAWSAGLGLRTEQQTQTQHGQHGLRTRS